MPTRRDATKGAAQAAFGHVHAEALVERCGVLRDGAIRES
jgi:hypothetical protein